MMQFCVGMQQGNLVGMQQNPVGYAQAFYPVGNGQAFYPYGTMQPMTCNPMNQSMPSNNGKPMQYEKCLFVNPFKYWYEY